ncbi:hypothetical protein LJB42_002942 [Komagataella kurtzmanii]|nr:hypothetical protein LJB42_002942 [Komagataella kurtzmanii]
MLTPQYRQHVLSPFEYVKPGTAIVNNSPDVTMTHNTIDNSASDFTSEIDFETAYNMLMTHDTLPSMGTSPSSSHGFGTLATSPGAGQQVFNGFQGYSSSSPDQQQKVKTPSNQIIPDPNAEFEYHRKQILKNSGANGSQPYSTANGVSPNTRNLLHSINSKSYKNMFGMFSNTPTSSSSGPSSDLLSLSESSVLTEFLDSLVDDVKLSSLSKHWSSIDPLATEKPLETGSPLNTMTLPELKLQNSDLKTNLASIPSMHKINLNFSNNSSADTSRCQSPSILSFKTKSDSLQPPLTSVKTEITHERIPRSPNKSTAAKRRATTCTNANKRKRSNDGRPLLSEDEKRRNHTSSEQRRRMIIKEAFEEFCSLTVRPDEKIRTAPSASFKPAAQKTRGKDAKKSLSKYLIMTKAINEIERLVEVNQKLKELLS